MALQRHTLLRTNFARMQRPSRGFLHKPSAGNTTSPASVFRLSDIHLSQRSSSMGTTRARSLYFSVSIVAGFAQSSTRGALWTLEDIRQDKTFGGR